MNRDMRNAEKGMVNVFECERDSSTMTLEQKLGMVMVGTCTHGADDLDYTFDLIRQKRLGAIWINQDRADASEIMARVKELATYPILICTDAENGFGDYTIAQAISLAAIGDSDLGYTFGKVTAVQMRQLGYNVVCNPVVDMASHNAPCGTLTRSFGSDKKRVARMVSAIARGMREAGVLTVAKHYPGGGNEQCVDTHMQEAVSMSTREELLDYHLYPYLEIMRNGHLCGVMTGHKRFPFIDPQHPASLSQRVIDVLREQGFDGLTMTDALVMMGVVLKYGQYRPIGLSIAAGNDLALPWGPSNRESMEALQNAYQEGVITDSRLDQAVRRVLAAQHLTLEPPEVTAITEQDREDFRRMNRDCIAVISDPGLSAAIPVNGKHLFVVLTEMNSDLNSGMADVDPQPREWYRPDQIARKIQSLFPASEVAFIHEFPTAAQNSQVLGKQLAFDDVVFVTFFKSAAYIGPECLTTRIIALMNALQTTKRICAVVHFGNPLVMEDIPHVPRILFGYCSRACTENAMDILSGQYPALGQVPVPIRLKED